MSQHDYNLADATGAAFRADANLLFQAIASMNSGATEPATKFANMGWFDTANNLMKVRKEDNSGWITIAKKTATEWKPYHGTVALEAAAMTWAADHDFGAQLLLSGALSPPQITGNQNNYNPTNLSGAIQLRLNSDASRNITGLAGGAEGRMMLVANIGSTNIVLVNQSASSTAGNRFLFASGDRTIAADESVMLRYDGVSSRWRAAQDTTGGATLVIKTADETVNNSTTLQNDDHLVFAMAANTTYLVDVVLLLDATGTDPDYKFKWTVPSGCTMFWDSVGGAGWASTSGLLLDTAGTEVDHTSANGTRGGNYKMFVRNGANAGNLQLQWAQDTADVSDTKILKHSHLLIRNLGAT